MQVQQEQQRSSDHALCGPMSTTLLQRWAEEGGVTAQSTEQGRFGEMKEGS